MNNDEKLQLLQNFEPLIKKSFKMYVRDINYFEDALQEGFLAILSCIENFDESKGTHFNGYVKMAVIYAIRDFSRKMKSNNISLDGEISQDGGSLYDIIEGEVNIEDEAVKKDYIRKLIEEVDKLTKKQKRVIKDYYFNNMSLVEISRSYRCHYMSAAALKDRGLKSLRKALKK